MAREKIILSFVFETFNLKNGEMIKEIRDDMKRYSEKKEIPIVESSNFVKKEPPVSYYDILATISPGEKYLSCFDWGERQTAKDYVVRLKSIFENKDIKEWGKGTFQNIFNEVYDYAMKKGFYIGWFDAAIAYPKIYFHDADFFITGHEIFRNIEVDYGGDIIKYAKEKRKEYGMPEPPSSCSTCLANCTNKEEQTLKKIIEKNNL